MQGASEILQGMGLLGVVGLIVWDWMKGGRIGGAKDKDGCTVDYSKVCQQEIVKLSTKMDGMHETIIEIKDNQEELFNRLRQAETRVSVLESKGGGQ